MNPYCYSISAPTEDEITIKGSKFIAYAYPVATLDDIDAHIDALKTAHHKARHHCYAYRLGATGETYRANDDGEPSGTAGLPIYNQLQSFDVSNTLIVVVRYFGGTLLGAPGLVRAYKQASEAALKRAKRVRIVPKCQFTVTLAYADVHTLMQHVEQWQMHIVNQVMDMTCTYTLECRQDDYDTIISALPHSIHLQSSADDA